MQLFSCLLCSCNIDTNVDVDVGAKYEESCQKIFYLSYIFSTKYFPMEKMQVEM